MERPFEGIASHLDLFLSLPSSWSGCLVLLAWAEVVLLLGLGGERRGVLGDAVPSPLLPALLHSRGAVPAAAACGSATAAVVLSPPAANCCCACCWLTAPPTGPFEVVPEKLFVSLFVIFRLVLLGSG